MRYKGQTFEMSIPVPEGCLSPQRIGEIEEAFGSEHERTYGHRASIDEPVQIVSIQVAGLAVRANRFKPGKAKAHDGDLKSEQPSRKAYFGREMGWLDTAILPRSALQQPRHGPCIIEEYDTTCVIPPEAVAQLDARDNIVITLKA
jgi:N-methylhydantoinase A